MLGGRSTDLLEELVHLGRIGAASPFSKPGETGTLLELESPLLQKPVHAR